MGNYPTKHNNKKNNENNDLAKNILTGIGIAGLAYVSGKGLKAATDAYNTKRKYDSIDNVVDKLFGNLPIIGGLFK